jgi:hypothetical protein
MPVERGAGGPRPATHRFRGRPCGRARCRPRTRLHASGRPVEVVAADDRIVLVTTTGVQTFGLIG